MRIPIPEYVVDWLIKRAQKTPYFPIGPYMDRWWLFRTPWLNARIHKINLSDSDRDLHDHPWDYCTIILRGGYCEVTKDAVRWYGKGSVLFRKAESLHRLVILDGQPAYTLFIHRHKRRNWGFATAEGWVWWKRYPKEAF